MRKTFSTLGCPEDTLEEVMARALRFGFGTLELRALAGTLDLPAYLGQHYREPGRWAARLAAAGLEVAALDTSCRLTGAGEEARAELEAILPWAEAVGGVYLRVFDANAGAAAGDRAEALRLLEWWSDARARHGWRSDLMIETHDTLVTGAAITSFLAEAPPGTRLLWDAHHTWRKGGEDPVATWTRIGPAVVHLHVKDSVARPSARHPFTYVLPGTGEFPMRPLLARLQAEDYRGVLSLEWERKWIPELPPLDAALEAARDGWW